MKIETGVRVVFFDSERFNSNGGYYNQGALLEDNYPYIYVFEESKD
jgi:hypothetical protein